jgi:tRNA threonylcarbamoyladenosine biosynthesis protein TsaE
MRAGFTTASAEETERAGHALASLLHPADVIALSGDLGAGKTHLVQGVARGLAVEGAVGSPTFNILLVHRGRLPLYHFDLYRLEREDDLEDIDFFETLEGDGVSMIEWGDRFPRALPDDHLLVTIRRTGEDRRSFALQAHGERSAALMTAWTGALRAAGLAGAVVEEADA